MLVKASRPRLARR